MEPAMPKPSWRAWKMESVKTKQSLGAWTHGACSTKTMLESMEAWRLQKQNTCWEHGNKQPIAPKPSRRAWKHGTCVSGALKQGACCSKAFCIEKTSFGSMSNPTEPHPTQHHPTGDPSRSPPHRITTPILCGFYARSMRVLCAVFRRSNHRRCVHEKMQKCKTCRHAYRS